MLKEAESSSDSSLVLLQICDLVCTPVGWGESSDHTSAQSLLHKITSAGEPFHVWKQCQQVAP